MMKNKSDERLSRLKVYLSPFLHLTLFTEYANSCFLSRFVFFHGELMLSVDRHDENFMQKNILFLSSRINLKFYVPALPNDAQLLYEKRHIYIFLQELLKKETRINSPGFFLFGMMPSHGWEVKIHFHL
jgi:hypothetical protein